MKYIEKISSNPDFYYIPFPKKTNDVYLEINLKTGKASENDNEFGVGHLLEHYLVAKLGKNKKTQKLEVNGSISQEQTNYYLKSTKAKIIEEAKYFLDAILNPDFSDEQIFLSEKSAALNELSIKTDSIKEQVERIIRRERFKGNCHYARTSLDQLKNLKNKTIKDIEGYYRKFYVESNLVITLSGNKLNKKIIKEINDLIKSYRLSKKKIDFNPFLCQYTDFKIVKKEVDFVKRDVAIFLTFPGPSIYEAQPWQRVGINILCEMLSSSKYGLFNALRELGIYGLEYEAHSWRGAGLIIFASLIPFDKIMPFFKLWIEKVKEIKEGKISKVNLRKILVAKRKGERRAFMENIDRLDWLTWDLINYNRIIPLKEDLENLKKVNVDFIKDWANKIFKKDKLNLIFLGKNLKDIDEKEIERIIEF